MTAIIEAEAKRLAEQRRLDQLKTAKERNKWGQFATPPALSLEIARYAWQRLRHREGGFRFLDPAVGTGSFFGAFLQTFPHDRIEAATGIELDEPFAETAAAIWQRQGLRVIQGDFTKQDPQPIYNVVLTNPPYVRHHHLAPDDKQCLGNLVQTVTGLRPSGLSGLYCYFLLAGHAWLAENGLAVWLVPSEFMDVNYGDEVKRYLIEQVSLVQIHRFCPSDVQFDDALVSSAVVVFEKRKPPPDHEALFSLGGSLAEPAGSERIGLDDLRVTRKWTSLPRQRSDGVAAGTLTLGDFFTVKRGLATGNNDFFILPKSKLNELGILPECVRPILPSPRFLKQEIIDADAAGWPQIDRQLGIIDCHLDEAEIRTRWPRFADYLQTGKKQSVHETYLTSRRSPWYSQEKREPAPFLCTYMGRSLEKPFRFIWNRSRTTAANVYLLLYPKEFVAPQMAEKAEHVFAVLRSIQPRHFLTEGRVYGGGLYKMEPAELMRLPAGELAKVLDLDLHRQRSLFWAPSETRRSTMTDVRNFGLMTLANAAQLTQDDLAKRVLHDFCPRFAPLGRVVWLSDGGARAAHADKQWLRELCLSAADTAKLPDIVIDDPKRHRLWLIDLARSGRPTTAEKRAAMKASLRRADAHVLFVTALQNRRQFPRFISDALWGTVAWFADEPEHVVIFDDAPDPRLLGPSTKRSES